MNDSNTSSALKPLFKMLRRFHMTIFIVLLAGGLAYAVLMFTTILNDSSSDTTYTSPIGAGTIDQATLDRIKALHTSDEAVPTATNPPGRINPFSE